MDRDDVVERRTWQQKQHRRQAMLRDAAMLAVGCVAALVVGVLVQTADLGLEITLP